MSVEQVLAKISDHNADVLGCIATDGGRIFRHLPDMYDLLDAALISEHAENMFSATDELPTEHAPFDQLFLEYQGHSIFARRLDDGVLVLVNSPIERARFKKMQVGVNLFLKPLRRALDAHADAPAPGPEADTATSEPEAPKRKRYYRGVAY